MKRIQRAAALLTAVLLLTVAPVRAAKAPSFTDVPESHWAYESIRLASERGLINGVSDTAFGLGAQITRAQYAMMLCRLMEWNMLTPEHGSYSDNQDKNAWYYSAIETARANGALLKLDDACGPNEPLPREEMAAMTVRALGYSSLAGLVQDDCPFTDVTTNPGYIALAYRMGFMNGVDETRFSPRSVSTREQAAAVLLRVYDRTRGALSERTVVYSGGEKTPAHAVVAESLTGTGTPIPMSPRAPMESVYAAAVKAGENGAVVLNAKPYVQFVSNGAVGRGLELTASELDAYLADRTAHTYRSTRYASSYLTRSGSGGTTSVVWYETDEDIAGKVELCRLLGVGAVYLLKA